MHLHFEFFPPQGRAYQKVHGVGSSSEEVGATTEWIILDEDDGPILRCPTTTPKEEARFGFNQAAEQASKKEIKILTRANCPPPSTRSAADGPTAVTERIACSCWFGSHTHGQTKKKKRRRLFFLGWTFVVTGERGTFEVIWTKS